MTDGPRRTTMQFAASSSEFGRSGIPQPMSTTKPPPSAGRVRQSFAPGLQVPSTISRPQNGNPLLQSVTRPGPVSFGRTPLRNSARRTSQWGGGRMSILPPPPNLSQTQKDPRAIREKSVQQSMRNSIFIWLQETGFSHNLSKQLLLSPTAKDFHNIFEHLVLLVDPEFVFNKSTPKAFEDDIIPVLRTHNYPFVDSIDKKCLAAPASMHSWPTLLAALHWLTDLAKNRVSYCDSNEPSLQLPEHVPEIFDDPDHQHALALQYYNDAYNVFLSGRDDFSVQDANLEERYAKSSENVLAECNALNKQEELITAQEQELTASPYPKLSEENNNLKKDDRKFDELLAHFENRKRKTILQINQEEQAIADYSSRLQILRQEHESLSIKVKEQNLSPDQVTRMNTDYETLSRQLEELRKRKEDTSRAALELEVPLAKSIEIVDHVLDVYTTLLFESDFQPSEFSDDSSQNLRLESNFSSENPKELVRRAADRGVIDIKKEIRPQLSAVANRKRQQRGTLQDEGVGIEGDIDIVSAECQKYKDELTDLESRTAVLTEQAEEIREIAQQESSISNGEAMRLEKELGQARTNAMAHGRGAKARLQGLQIAYQEQIERVERFKDETVRAVIKSSSDIASFKEEVSNHLNHLRQYAEEN